MFLVKAAASATMLSAVVNAAAQGNGPTFQNLVQKLQKFHKPQRAREVLKELVAYIKEKVQSSSAKTAHQKQVARKLQNDGEILMGIKNAMEKCTLPPHVWKPSDMMGLNENISMFIWEEDPAGSLRNEFGIDEDQFEGMLFEHRMICKTEEVDFKNDGFRYPAIRRALESMEKLEHQQLEHDEKDRILRSIIRYDYLRDLIMDKKSYNIAKSSNLTNVWCENADRLLQELIMIVNAKYPLEDAMNPGNARNQVARNQRFNFLYGAICAQQTITALRTTLSKTLRNDMERAKNFENELVESYYTEADGLAQNECSNKVQKWVESIQKTMREHGMQAHGSKYQCLLIIKEWLDAVKFRNNVWKEFEVSHTKNSTKFEDKMDDFAEYIFENLENMNVNLLHPF